MGKSGQGLPRLGGGVNEQRRSDVRQLGVAGSVAKWGDHLLASSDYSASSNSASWEGRPSAGRVLECS